MTADIRLAPLAGITDWPFRLLCFEQGCSCATTEMVSALGYAYAPKSRAVQSLLERHPDEPRLIVQIFGKEPAFMAKTARALSATGLYDGIDVNMGCPAHKVAAGGEGAGLMRDPKAASSRPSAPLPRVPASSSSPTTRSRRSTAPSPTACSTPSTRTALLPRCAISSSSRMHASFSHNPVPCRWQPFGEYPRMAIRGVSPNG